MVKRSQIHDVLRSSLTQHVFVAVKLERTVGRKVQVHRSPDFQMHEKYRTPATRLRSRDSQSIDRAN
jgi:hypothetical protein